MKLINLKNKKIAGIIPANKNPLSYNCSEGFGDNQLPPQSNVSSITDESPGGAKRSSMGKPKVFYIVSEDFKDKFPHRTDLVTEGEVELWVSLLKEYFLNK